MSSNAVAAAMSRGTKRPFEVPQIGASSSGSSSQSSSGPSLTRAKQYDFEREIVPMCARIGEADLLQLRELLNKLIRDEKIAHVEGIEHWSKEKTCAALQKYFVGLAVHPTDVNEVHGQVLQTIGTNRGGATAAAAASSTAPTPRSSVWEAAQMDSYPSALGKFLSLSDIKSLSQVSKDTKGRGPSGSQGSLGSGLDLMHQQCDVVTQKGTQCLRIKQATGSSTTHGDICRKYCDEHIYGACLGFMAKLDIWSEEWRAQYTQQMSDQHLGTYGFKSLEFDVAVEIPGMTLNITFDVGVVTMTFGSVEDTPEANKLMRDTWGEWTKAQANDFEESVRLFQPQPPMEIQAPDVVVDDDAVGIVIVDWDLLPNPPDEWVGVDQGDGFFKPGVISRPRLREAAGAFFSAMMHLYLHHITNATLMYKINPQLVDDRPRMFMEAMNNELGLVGTFEDETPRDHGGMRLTYSYQPPSE